MAESLKGPFIYNPKTLTELLQIKANNPSVLLLAGGTDIMTKPGYYPNPDQPDIVNLSGVTELSRVLHSERFLEVGAMVTVSQLLTTSSYVLSKPMFKAIENIATSLVRNQATIGGSLCATSKMGQLPCFLAAIGTQAELKVVSKRGKNSYSVQTRWLPVIKMYNSDGTLTIPENAVLTKIRIPSYEHDVQICKTIGDINRCPDESLSLCLCYSLLQRTVMNPTLVIVFPKGGFFTSGALDESIGSITLPVKEQQVLAIVKLLETELDSECPGISDLQKERAKRQLQAILYESNTSYLAG